jgi:hypothetical protein
MLSDYAITIIVVGSVLAVWAIADAIGKWNR